MTEIAQIIPCNGEELVAILHQPMGGPAEAGVVIVVGGPQYRAGSHRQFVSLARHLAASGLAVLRFDVRGMGDSSGDFPEFENIDDDIESAIDCLKTQCPALKKIYLWGLCDAASAILFYAHKDPRVTGTILVNPWVRTEESHAKTQLRHYYGTRFLSGHFWKRFIGGQVSLRDAASSFARTVLRLATRGEKAGSSTQSLPDRMAAGLRAFSGPALFIISGRDLTAQEFMDVVKGDPEWQALMDTDRVTVQHLNQADHTFSRREWQETTEGWTANWIKNIS